MGNLSLSLSTQLFGTVAPDGAIVLTEARVAGSNPSKAASGISDMRTKRWEPTVTTAGWACWMALSKDVRVSTAGKFWKKMTGQILATRVI